MPATPGSRLLFRAKSRLLSASDPITSGQDEQQAPEWELDALSLAGSNQESCVSGANRV
jgi:hypothetical protein